MKTDMKVCIGATIAIFAGLLIAAIVFDIHIENGLAVVGFGFLVGLPIYIGYRRGEKHERTAITHELCMRFNRCQEVVEEIDEYLDESIVGFRECGRYIKESEKVNEKTYYAEVALLREAGMDTGRLSAEFAQYVGYLIRIRRKLEDIRYLLELT